jgi:hypothetical protein
MNPKKIFPIKKNNNNKIKRKSKLKKKRKLKQIKQSSLHEPLQNLW